MVMSTPFISVIIPNHRKGRFFEEAVKSVLEQTLETSKFEIIVVRDYRDEFVSQFLKLHNITDVIIDEVPLGPKLAKGIEISKGEVVSFLEDDDLFIPNKLEFVYDMFYGNQRLLFYHDRVKTISENGNYKTDLLRKKNSKAMKVSVGNKTLKCISRMIEYSSHMDLSAISIKRRIVTQRIETLKNMNMSCDSLMFYSSLDQEGGDMIIDNREWTKYRIHASSSSIVGNLDEFVKSSVKFHSECLSGFLNIKSTVHDEETLKFIERSIIESRYILYLLTFDLKFKLKVRDFINLVVKNWLIYCTSPYYLFLLTLSFLPRKFLLLIRVLYYHNIQVRLNA